METQTPVRIIFNVRGDNPENVKAEFEESCKTRGQDMSEALNAMLRAYIKKTGQAVRSSQPRNQ